MEHALTRYRKDTGLTLEAFAARIGASKGTISKWENGKAIPRPDSMRKITELTERSVTANDWYAEATQ